MPTNRCNMIMLSQRDKKAITGDWSREKKLILFPDYLPRETFRLGENKIKCFPRDQSLSDLLYSPRRKNIFVYKFLKINLASGQHSRVTVNCYHLTL